MGLRARIAIRIFSFMGDERLMMATLRGCDIFYMAGFPLTHEGGGKTVAAICALAGKTVCMNLSAPFIVQVPPFRAALLENLKSCSYVFCNESEAAALLVPIVVACFQVVVVAGGLLFFLFFR